MHDFVEWAARFTWKLAASTCFDNLPSLPLSFILLFLPEIVRLSVIWKNLVILYIRYFISILLSLPLLLPRQLIEELGEFLKKLRDAKTSNHEILRINKRNGDGTEEERSMVFSFPEKRFWPESLRAKVKLSRVESSSPRLLCFSSEKLRDVECLHATTPPPSPTFTRHKNIKAPTGRALACVKP